MGDNKFEPFQFAFNGFLKVAFQGSQVTSDAGLVLVRELDECLGLEAINALAYSSMKKPSSLTLDCAGTRTK